jgi:hypothetical protein
MTYFSYIHRLNLARADRPLPGMRRHPMVPGSRPDTDPRKKFKHKFDRWVNRPTAAMRLYWRTHPQYLPQQAGR